MTDVAARPIRVYLHVAGMGHAREVVRELAGQISASGLHDAAAALCCLVVGGPRFSLDYCLPPKWEVRICGELDDYEYPTLRWAWEQARARSAHLVCYAHTKSASKDDRRHRRYGEAWRRVMAHWTIERWREAATALVDAELAGPLLASAPYPHYSGNFWWARSEYLARLAAPAPDPAHGAAAARLNAEIWPLSGGGRAANLYALRRSLRADYNSEGYRR